MKSIMNILKTTAFGIGFLSSVALANAEKINGRVIDALTDQPVEQIAVFSGNQNNYTDSYGNYEINTDQGLQRFRVSDNLTNYFNYDEEINVTTDTLKNVWMIPKREVDTNYYPDFLIKFKSITNADHPTGSNKRIYQWAPMPIPIYYNEQQAYEIFISKYGDEQGNNIAQLYFDVCDTALKEWEEKSRVDLFQRIYEDPEYNQEHYGIKIDYSDDSSYVIGPEWVGEWPYTYPAFGKLFIDNARGTWPNGNNILRMIWEHELGHCMLLFHSNDPRDNMNGHNTNNISSNDADIVKIMYTLPNWTDMRNYNNIQPRNAVKDYYLYE